MSGWDFIVLEARRAVFGMMRQDQSRVSPVMYTVSSAQPNKNKIVFQIQMMPTISTNVPPTKLPVRGVRNGSAGIAVMI